MTTYTFNRQSYREFHTTELRHNPRIDPRELVEQIVRPLTENYSNERIDLTGSIVALKFSFTKLHKTNSYGCSENSDDLLQGQCTNPNGVDTLEKPMWSRAYNRTWKISVKSLKLDGGTCEIESFYLRYPTIFRFSDTENLWLDEDAESRANEMIQQALDDFKRLLTTFLSHAIQRFES